MEIPKHLNDKVYWINPAIDNSSLLDRIRTLDIFISDLDDTVAPCQAISVVLDKLSMNPQTLINPKMWSAGISYIFDSQESAWEKFTKHFLKEEERKAIKNKYSPEYVDHTLFPGYSEFLSLIPDKVKKILLTGNIPEITEAYKDFLGFNIALSDQFDKEKGIKKILAYYPKKRNIWFSGDEHEDECALEFLKYKSNKEDIDNVLSLYVTSSPSKINEKFDINIARDYTGLNELLSK